MDPAQTDPGARSIISQLVIMLILILINAFFAASEMALVSVDDHRMGERAENGDRKAKRILKLMEDPSRFLSTIQICITLAGFFNSAAAATGLAQYLGIWFARLNLPSPYQVATVLLTIFLSFLTIVFGELIPKRLALFLIRCQYPLVGCKNPPPLCLPPLQHHQWHSSPHGD